jgi:hypothetical protein
MFLLYKHNYLLAGNVLYTTCTVQYKILLELTEATRHEEVGEAKGQLLTFSNSSLDGDVLKNVRLKL